MDNDREQLIQEIIFLADKVSNIVEHVTGRPKNHTQMGRAKLREMNLEQLLRIKVSVNSFYVVLERCLNQPSKLAEI